AATKATATAATPTTATSAAAAHEVHYFQQQIYRELCTTGLFGRWLAATPLHLFHDRAHRRWQNRDRAALSGAGRAWIAADEPSKKTRSRARQGALSCGRKSRRRAHALD